MISKTILKTFHDLRENILYKLSFEKLIRDEQQTDKAILKDDDE